MRPGSKKTSCSNVGHDKCVVADNALPQALAPSPPRVKKHLRVAGLQGDFAAKGSREIRGQRTSVIKPRVGQQDRLIIECNGLCPPAIDRRE